VVKPMTIFLSSRLITVQKKFSHTVWAHVEGPKIGGGGLEPHSLGIGTV